MRLVSIVPGIATVTSPRVASASSSSSSSGEPGASGSGPLNLAPSEATTYRPTGRSIGIGFGYTMPGTSFSTPNTISARLQLKQTLTLEPIARLDVSSSNGKIGTVKNSSTSFALFAGTALRKRLAARQMVDAVGILQVGVGVNSSSGKTAGVTTSLTEVSLGSSWGLGAEFWPKQHWSISLDATNPLLSVGNTSGKQPDPASGAIVKESSTTIFAGAVWDPSVVLMTHLYY